MSKSKANMKRIILLKLTFIFVFTHLVSCTSSGPATSYYSLFSSAPLRATTSATPKLDSIGVALVNLPGYLANASIVSRTSGQKINVSGYHAWAEPLDAAATRAIAGNLRTLLSAEKVNAFPWDMRLRPENQLMINIEQFDGIRGEYTRLISTWSLYNINNKAVVISGQFQKELPSETNTYESYVASLNELLTFLSQDIANNIQLL